MRPILSASNLAAAALCLGKPNMERGLTDKPSPDSVRGTNLHRYFQTDLNRGTLSAGDREFMGYSDGLAEQFLETFRNAAGIDADEPFTKENEISLEGIIPGHPDAVFSWRDGAIVAVLDLKTGPVEIDSAEENDQLGAYSALLWQRKPFQLCGVCIVQPGSFGPRTSSALYQSKQMSGVLDYIGGIAMKTMEPDAPRAAGEKQCRFCRATAICPQWKAKYMALEPIALTIATETVPTPELMAGVEKIQAMRGKRGDEWLGEARRRVAAGAVPGWRLRNTGSVREMFSPMQAFGALRDWCTEEGYPPLTAKAFDACRTMTWGKLEELFANITQLSQKKAKETLKEVLSPYVVETEKEKAIVQEK